MIERDSASGITTLRLAHGKASALDTELCTALAESLREEESNDTRAVILTGTGSIFCAGVDLFRMTSEGGPYVDSFIAALEEAFLRLFTFPKPLVAAINGHAIAGGCLIAAAADYRIMSVGRIGVPELLVGVPFPAIAIEILRFAAGRDAQWLAYSGRTVQPDEAKAVGLIDEQAAAEQLMQRAGIIAGQLAAIHPDNFRITKQQLRRDSLDRIKALRDLDKEGLKIWKDADTHARVRDYLAKTIKK